MKHTRPVWAEVSRSSLLNNYRILRRRLEGTDSAAQGAPGILAVVKADAYGHGALECARTLHSEGAEWLGVTSVEEGVAVRAATGPAPAAPDAVIPAAILVMCGAWPGEGEAVLEHGLTPVVWEHAQLDMLERAARSAGLPAGSVPVHVEVDTGMARQGVPVTGGAGWMADLLLRFRHDSPLRLDGVLTHFASAEEVNAEQNAIQMQRFELALGLVAARGLKPRWVHAGNSATLIAGRELPKIRSMAEYLGARWMVRPGLGLYGYTLPLIGALASSDPILLEPVMSWKAKVLAIRTIEPGDTVGYNATFLAERRMRLALLPVGYADGLDRRLSGATGKQVAYVLVRGAKAAITGRISMDLTMVDVTDIPGVMAGDEAVLLGAQQRMRIGADDHAMWAGTIPYEIVCGISVRVPRVFVD